MGGLKTAVLPDDSGVELSCVQVDYSETGRGEAFTKTGQHSPEDLHICGEIKAWLPTSLCSSEFIHVSMTDWMNELIVYNNICT